MEIYMNTMLGIDSVFARLLLSAVCGFMIGLDREYKNRGAGTRTHALVCMASCLVMLTSEYLALTFPGYNGDVARLGAQVISGMGFIGAGTIIITRYNHVRGLTTAASLWATACLGLAVGAGFLKAAAAAVVIMLFLLITVERLDRFMKTYSKTHDYMIVFSDIGGMSQFLDAVKKEGIKIDNVDVSRSSDSEIIMIITLESKKDLSEFMLTLETRTDIKMLNEL